MALEVRMHRPFQLGRVTNNYRARQLTASRAGQRRGNRLLFYFCLVVLTVMKNVGAGMKHAKADFGHFPNKYLSC
jgi:hypothetical protein